MQITRVLRTQCTDRVHAIVVLQKKAELVFGLNLVYSGWEFSLQLDNQSITTRNRTFISSTDMQKYGFYSAGVCISHRCVIGGLGWVKKNGPTSISDIHCTAQFINRHSAPRPSPIRKRRNVYCCRPVDLFVTHRVHCLQSACSYESQARIRYETPF